MLHFFRLLGGGQGRLYPGRDFYCFRELSGLFFVYLNDMTYMHTTEKSSMTLGSGKFTAYFTRLMGVPLTLLSRMRHVA